MAYEIAISGAAARDAAGLPVEARVLLSVAWRELAEYPWTGKLYDPRWSLEFRTVTLGDGRLITYIVSERRRLVVVGQVIWGRLNAREAAECAGSGGLP